MSTLVEFHGGPLDGERRELESAPPVLRIPYYRAPDDVRGFEDYRLSDRYQLPPLVYEYVGLSIPEGARDE